VLGSYSIPGSTLVSPCLLVHSRASAPRNPQERAEHTCNPGWKETFKGSFVPHLQFHSGHCLFSSEDLFRDILFPIPCIFSLSLSLFLSLPLSLSLFWVVLGIKVRASCFLGRHYYHLSHTPAFFAFICFDRVSRFCLEPGLGPSSSYLYLLSNWNYRCESLYQALSLFLDSI
jgi:hypothetical protein